MKLLKIFQRKPKAVRQFSEWEIEWLDVIQKCPVGRSFQYLGRTMIVAQHKFNHDTGCFEFVCEYADNKGTLREWWFVPRMRELFKSKHVNFLD